jgi:hypothetical protein
VLSLIISDGKYKSATQGTVHKERKVWLIIIDLFDTSFLYLWRRLLRRNPFIFQYYLLHKMVMIVLCKKECKKGLFFAAFHVQKVRFAIPQKKGLTGVFFKIWKINYCPSKQTTTIALSR